MGLLSKSFQGNKEEFGRKSEAGCLGWVLPTSWLNNLKTIWKDKNKLFVPTGFLRVTWWGWVKMMAHPGLSVATSNLNTFSWRSLTKKKDKNPKLGKNTFIITEKWKPRMSQSNLVCKVKKMSYSRPFTDASWVIHHTHACKWITFTVHITLV